MGIIPNCVSSRLFLTMGLWDIPWISWACENIKGCVFEMGVEKEKFSKTFDRKQVLEFCCRNALEQNRENICKAMMFEGEVEFALT